MAPSILFVACDAYLAGIYGRKFELDGWDVEVVEELQDGERKAMKLRPDVMVIDTGCLVDLVEEMKRLRAMPTLLQTKMVVLARGATHEEIQEALNVGVDTYLLLGHFVPQEMLSKIKKLIGK